MIRNGPDWPANLRNDQLGFGYDFGERRRLQRRMHEREIEGEVEFIADAVEPAHGSNVDHIGFAEQDPWGLVPIGQRAPMSQDIVDLGPVDVVDHTLAERSHVRWIVLCRQRIVPELPVFDDAVCDVDPEAGHPPIEPESIDLVEGIRNLRIPPVEIRLLGEEVVQVILAGVLVAGPGRPTEGADPVIRVAAIGFWVGPYVPVPMTGTASRAGIGKPGMAIAAVVGNDVEDDPDAALCRLANQPVDVAQVTESRLDVAVVGDVVTVVGVGRNRDRAQPDGIDTEPLKIIEPADDTREIADAVAVRVLERTHIDLVDDAIAPPLAGRHCRPS